LIDGAGRRHVLDFCSIGVEKPMRMMTMPSGLTLHCVDARRGDSQRPPVLFIHGMFGGAWQFDRWLPLVADRGYEARALNLRGHHGSRPVANLGAVSVMDFVDDALEAARAMGAPVVLGHSMGGLIAQKMAEAGAVRAAILLCAAPPRGIPVTSLTLIGRQLKHLPAMLASRPINPDRSDADWLMFNRTPAAEADAIFERLTPESGTAGREMSLGAISVNQTHVKCPVLSVTSSDDRFVVPRIGRALAAKYAAEQFVAEGNAHLVISEAGWEKVASRVLDWLDRVLV
jgi:pimeloyl-ACP methyl ester carboxylesterase